MSEADVRTTPSRGRSSTRGGRGGHGRGGPRGSRKVNGTSNDSTAMEESLEEQGEIGEMKKKHLAELSMLKDIFPDWTDTDLVFALQEADGDVEATVEKITQGAVSQFAEVKKTKDRARSKAKDDSAPASATDKPAFAARGGRGRGGLESGRGGRGRASDRGRGGHRGGRGGHATTNGTHKESVGESIPTTESSAWDTPANATAADGGWDTADAANDAADAGQSAWGNVITSEATPATASEGAKSSLIPEGGPKKSWASMFAKPKPAPAPVPPKQILTRQHPPAELVAAGEIPVPAPASTAVPPEEAKEPEPLPQAMPMPQAAQEPEEPAAAEPVLAPVERPLTSESESVMLTPSKDPLTEENVEHLPDESHPPATNTVASTAGSIDPRNLTPSNLTPLPSQQPPIGSRPSLGGFATSAQRLASMGGRSASYQRRVQEQQEAVVMPGHNAVDRAAVQFGSMGINGEPGPDVDEEREEAETRQAPQHSPPSQPRTSLPPVAAGSLPPASRQSSATQDAGMPEALPTPKQAPGLPPASAQNQQQIQDPSLTQGLPQTQDTQMGHAYNQYGRYGQQVMQQDAAAQQQKPYDPFSHQASQQQHQFDQYPSHTQAQQHAQQHAQSNFGGLSSAPNDYASYYTSEAPRNAYNQYYGNAFGVPQDSRGHNAQAQIQHDSSIGQQRSASGFGAGSNDSTFATQAGTQAQSRFGDAPGSGNNTPNPMMGAQPSVPSAQQQHHQHQQQPSQHSTMHPQVHGQQPSGYGPPTPGFPYGHPYYNSPYQTAYQNQFGYSHQLQGGYGSGGSSYPNKQSNMYGGHNYGMSSQSSYDQHSASPANASAFAQNQQASMRSASGMGSGLAGLDEYGRSSTQPASQQQHSSSFGAMNDPFARSTSGFGTQAGYGQQSMTAGPEDSLKPYNDSKGGPSPALGQPGRPGSAANSAAATSQAGLPPPQTQHSAFGGYPGFPGQGSQYGGLGGLGGHQQGQGGMGGQSVYGGYGGFNQTYGGYGASRGGWGANYGGH